MIEKASSDLHASTAESVKPEWAAIGQRLVSIRGQSTQPEMAAALKVSKTTYGRWERGVREIGAEALRSYAKQGWNPLWILTGQGSERLDQATQHERDTYTLVQGDRTDPEFKAAARRRDQAIKDWSAGLQQGLSQPVRLDQGTLAQAIELVQGLLESRDETLTAADFAEAVSRLYVTLTTQPTMLASNVTDISQYIAKHAIHGG